MRAASSRAGIPVREAGSLASLAQSDGLVMLAEEAERVEEGSTAPFLPYAGLFAQSRRRRPRSRPSRGRAPSARLGARRAATSYRLRRRGALLDAGLDHLEISLLARQRTPPA